VSLSGWDVRLVFGVSAFCFAETCLISTSVNPLTALKTGGRG